MHLLARRKGESVRVPALPGGEARGLLRAAVAHPKAP